MVVVDGKEGGETAAGEGGRACVLSKDTDTSAKRGKEGKTGPGRMRRSDEGAREEKRPEVVRSRLSGIVGVEGTSEGRTAGQGLASSPS